MLIVDGKILFMLNYPPRWVNYVEIINGICFKYSLNYRKGANLQIHDY